MLRQNLPENIPHAKGQHIGVGKLVNIFQPYSKNIKTVPDLILILGLIGHQLLPVFFLTKKNLRQLIFILILFIILHLGVKSRQIPQHLIIGRGSAVISGFT